MKDVKGKEIKAGVLVAYAGLGKIQTGRLIGIKPKDCSWFEQRVREYAGTPLGSSYYSQERLDDMKNTFIIIRDSDQKRQYIGNKGRILVI